MLPAFMIVCSSACVMAAVLLGTVFAETRQGSAAVFAVFFGFSAVIVAFWAGLISAGG